MSENAGEADRREELQKVYKTAEDALRIISDAGSLVV